jgi:hypothetical protein
MQKKVEKINFPLQTDKKKDRSLATLALSLR